MILVIEKKFIGENNMFLSHYQIIKEGEQDKFAVIDIEEFKKIRSLLNNPEKLHDYLDYLHIQEI